jgi:hypothetical protein
MGAMIAGEVKSWHREVSEPGVRQKYDAAVADGILERRVRKKKQRKAKGRPPADSISEEAATRYASFGMVALYSILAGQ